MMKKLNLAILLVSCFLSFAANTSYAQTHKGFKGDIRVLMIGNSFSGNASVYLRDIAKSGNHKITLERAEMGGCSLQRHWDSVQVNVKDSLRGRPYNGKSLKQMLMNGKYDAISLQQYSLLSGDSATYQPYATYLYSMIRQYQPQARIFIHETWPYRQDAKAFGQVAANKRAANQQEMYDKLKQAYLKLANDLHATLIPSGDAFYKVGNDKTRGFKKDNSFDPAKAVYPALPADSNSLNIGYQWDNKQKLQFDANHANSIGCYLAGLVWYTTLFNEDPTKLSFKPDAVTEDKAAYLKKTAREVALKK